MKMTLGSFYFCRMFNNSFSYSKVYDFSSSVMVDEKYFFIYFDNYKNMSSFLCFFISIPAKNLLVAVRGRTWHSYPSTTLFWVFRVDADVAGRGRNVLPIVQFYLAQRLFPGTVDKVRCLLSKFLEVRQDLALNIFWVLKRSLLDLESRSSRNC